MALGPSFADAASVLTVTLPLPYTPTFLGAPCVLQAVTFAGGDSSLVYRSAGDALDGFTAAQILTTANFALSGLGLPAGHPFGTRTSLVDDLNRSIAPCVVSPWARPHHFVR